MFRGQADLLNCSQKQVAFTLAEVLITLAIIGVVAAVTMPMLITNIKERTYTERHVNIVQKITQAMEHMRATGKLVQYDSTEAFVEELQKHLKIVKICDNTHLSECWASDVIINPAGQNVNINDVKTGKNLSVGTNSNNIALVLADGASILLNYDTNFKGMDIGDKVTASNKTLPVGNGKTKEFTYTTNVTAPIDFIMDVNGKRGPNRELHRWSNRYFDIRSFKSAGTVPACQNGTVGCIVNLVNSYYPLDCSNSNSSDELYQTYCGEHPSGYTNDYWAGAKYACAKIGMTLPDFTTLENLYNHSSEYSSVYGSPQWYISSTEFSANMQGGARIKFFGDGGVNSSAKNVQRLAVCIE